MNVTIKIDDEKIKELNKDRTEAFYGYLDRVVKNNTPIILSGKKKSDFWECSITECATPTSIFTNILLPASEDENPENTELAIQLTGDIIKQFENNTKIVFKDTTVEITRNNLELKDSRKESSENPEKQLKEFRESLEEAEKADIKFTLKIDQNSELVGFLKELKSSVDASIFISNSNITLRKDSVFFRAKNNIETFTGDGDLYINMYLANLIMNYLKFCSQVVLEIKGYYTVVSGYINEDLIMKNVSAAFDAPDENPSDEDLNSIVPIESESQIIDLDIKDFISNLEKQKSSISAFTGMRNWTTKIYKNGAGVSFGFLKDSNSASTALAVIHIGEVTKKEVSLEDFPDFSTVLPVELLKNLFTESLSLKIVYQANEETAVLFQVGNSKILSGKIY